MARVEEIALRKHWHGASGVYVWNSAPNGDSGDLRGTDLVAACSLNTLLFVRTCLSRRRGVLLVYRITVLQYY